MILLRNLAKFPCRRLEQNVHRIVFESMSLSETLPIRRRRATQHWRGFWGSRRPIPMRTPTRNCSEQQRSWRGWSIRTHTTTLHWVDNWFQGHSREVFISQKLNLNQFRNREQAHNCMACWHYFWQKKNPTEVHLAGPSCLWTFTHWYFTPIGDNPMNDSAFLHSKSDYLIDEDEN